MRATSVSGAQGGGKVEPDSADTKQDSEPTPDFERSLALGERSIGLLKQIHSPAVPRNYELLYTFCTGQNKALADAIRKAIETDSCLTEAAAERIYHTYLAPGDISEQVEKVGSQVTQQMSEIMSVIEAACERTGVYGESLKGLSGRLGAIDSPQQLKTIIEELFITTNEMAQYNQLLEQRLADAKSHVEELQMRLEISRVESFTDELTGLTNRKRFYQALELEMAEAEESEEPLALMMMDIDHFKSFNDTYGHQTGDQVIKLAANTIKTNVKGRDYAARYGGEEFAVLLPKTKLVSGITVAEQIRTAIKTKELIRKSTGESLGHVTISAGVAVYEKGETACEFVQRADACLYAAKQAGRDTVKCQTDLRDAPPAQRTDAA